jgi:hypothetical protein
LSRYVGEIYCSSVQGKELLRYYFLCVRETGDRGDAVGKRGGRENGNQTEEEEGKEIRERKRR